MEVLRTAKNPTDFRCKLPVSFCEHPKGNQNYEKLFVNSYIFFS